MDFHPIVARPGWRDQVQEHGFSVALMDDPPYWVESTDKPFCAAFSPEEVQKISAAATELYQLSLKLVEEVCNGASSDAYFDSLQISSYFRNCVRKSWQRRDRSVYGRFDFVYNGNSLKLLELNFDTPGCLYESALLQRLWLEESRALKSIPSEATQCNSIEKKLIDVLGGFAEDGEIFHLGAFKDAIEQIENLKYIRSCAIRAGADARFIFFDDLRFDKEGHFVDLQGKIITKLFKIFQWQSLIEDDEDNFEERGRYLFAPLIESGITSVIEPPWKAILSDKAVLPLLWNLAPGNQYLLETCFDDDSTAAQRLRCQPHVRKPVLGFEGGGISINFPGEPAEFGEEPNFTDDAHGHVLQAFSPLSTYDDYFVVLSGWIIGEEFAGLSMRADRNKVTGRSALFVPHYVR